MPRSAKIPSHDYLFRASDSLQANEFELVGRDEEIRRISGILLRSKANSVLLVGPGGVGCTAICLGLEALKSDPEASFDIRNKRFFWLEVDALFASGDAEQINQGFTRAVATLSRSPETVLMIEDTRNFIEAARNAGCSHLINSLVRDVRNKKFQVILESRDDDLEIVLKAHSDMREILTLLEITEPEEDKLKEIVKFCVIDLENYHRISVTDEAIETAISQTDKYRVSDLSLSRAQPERSLTLIDRALTSYRLSAHSEHPLLVELRKRIDALAGQTTDDAQNESSRLKTKYDSLQNQLSEQRKQISELSKEQLKGEEAIRDLENELLALQSEAAEDDEREEEVTTKGGFSIMQAGFDSKQVRALKDEIKRFQAQVDLNRKRYNQLSAEFNQKLALRSEHILKEFSQISGIPLSKLGQDERQKLLNLRADLASRVYGQDHVVEKLADSIRVARAGLQSRNKPQAAFLFLGPSGVGKTELAKALTISLMDDERSLLRFDMSEYMEKHAVAKLIGAPPGYEGYEAGGILTNALRKNPNRIILFDEIEKAHPDLFNVFLQIIDDARLTDNRGLTVSFTETVIIMTTNIGTPHLLNENIDYAEAQSLALEDLAQEYRPEFLNRFNGRRNIVCFNRLSLQIIQKIATREISKLNTMLQTTHPEISISILEHDLADLCADNYQPINGARGIIGFIADGLKPSVANQLLHDPSFTGQMHFTYDRAEKKLKLRDAVSNA